MSKDVQRAERVDAFFGQHQGVLAWQGAVVPRWKFRGGRRFGPYYYLECRVSGSTKKSVYVGLDGPHVAAVKSRLGELQRPLRERRQMAMLLDHNRRLSRAARITLAQVLDTIGLDLKGSEIRGRGEGTPLRILAAHLAGDSSETSEKLEK